MVAKEASKTLTAFRLEQALLDRLDAHAARMTEAMPGVTFTRSQAVRTLLIKALDLEERIGGVAGRRR